MRKADRRFRMMLVALVAVLAPGAPVAAQETPGGIDPLERLAEVLPPEVAGDVLARIEAARARGLPERPLANLALEAAAKGRDRAATVRALESLSERLARADEALRAAGRRPAGREVEAGAVALQMGVQGAAISELARSGPSGRSLSVPLLVLGGLAERGLPSDRALERVLERLQARADDRALVDELARTPGGRGFGPPELPGAGAPGRDGGRRLGVPPTGPLDRIGPPSERPGRGGPPDGVPADPPTPGAPAGPGTPGTTGVPGGSGAPGAGPGA